jgi:hypothetical protein
MYGVMATTNQTHDLIAEIRRYLAVVELFRAEGREPHWSSEVAIGPRLEAAATLREPHLGRR